MESSPKEIWERIKKSGQMTEEDTAIVFYSLPRLKKRLRGLTTVFGHKDAVSHFVAIKTNPHPAILRCIIREGFGLEAASFEEVLLAVRAGGSPNNIVFNSPVKTHREIKTTLKNYPDIFINANSLAELHRFPREVNAKIGLRINPCITPGTDTIFNVSTKDSKFGVPISKEDDILKAVLQYDLRALHIHVGSQITNFANTVEGIKAVYRLAKKANKLVAKNGDATLTGIRYLNIGGGIPAGQTEKENARNMQRYVHLIEKEIPELFNEFKVITEFGQWTHRLNGMSFSRVEYTRSIDQEKEISYIHLGADMFPREIYTSKNYFSYQVLQQHENSTPRKTYDIAGPLCYNGDFLIKDIALPKMTVGDIFVIENTGANTFGLWSRHCSRTIPKFVSDMRDEKDICILSPRKNPFYEF